MATDSPWRVGRRFRVLTGVLAEGRVYRPGDLFEVGRFSMLRVINNAGTPQTSYWQSTEEERHQLIQAIQWDDERPAKISNGLRRFIEKCPESKFVRGFVRQELGIVPEKAKTPKTAEEWLTFIEGVEPVPVQVAPTNRVQEGIAALIRAGGGGGLGAGGAGRVMPVVTEATIDVTVRAHERVYGRHTYHREDFLSGTIPIPVRLIEAGNQDDITQYIYDHYPDFLRRREGELIYGETEDDDETDGLVIEHTNLTQVRAAREAELITQAATARLGTAVATNMVVIQNQEDVAF